MSDSRLLITRAATAEQCFLPVIYEDHDLLILNKKSGTPSVPHSPDEIHTAVNAALAHCPALVNIGRGGLEPGILHRLDNGTSGVLVFAKNQATFDLLHEKWKTPAIRKIYRAISLRRLAPPESHATPAAFDLLKAHLPHRIDLSLIADPRSKKRMRVWNSRLRSHRNLKTIAASTMIHSVRPQSQRETYDIEVEIETGARHQIRCHLAHLGFPILGDPIYGQEQSTRLWLHAWKIKIQIPNSIQLTVEAPLPPDWDAPNPY